MGRSPNRSPKLGKTNAPIGVSTLTVPPENVEFLRETVGIDMRQDPAQVRAAVVRMAMSISHSPYPSADMLAEYRDKGFPELATKVIATIDQQTAHRQSLERTQVNGAQSRLLWAQRGAMALGFFGIGAAAIAAYFAVSTTVCVTIVIVAVGGPNAATVVGRILDRTKKATSV